MRYRFSLYYTEESPCVRQRGQGRARMSVSRAALGLGAGTGLACAHHTSVTRKVHGAYMVPPDLTQGTKQSTDMPKLVSKVLPRIKGRGQRVAHPWLHPGYPTQPSGPRQGRV